MLVFVGMNQESFALEILNIKHFFVSVNVEIVFENKVDVVRE